MPDQAGQEKSKVIRMSSPGLDARYVSHLENMEVRNACPLAQLSFELEKVCMCARMRTWATCTSCTFMCMVHVRWM